MGLLVVSVITAYSCVLLLSISHSYGSFYCDLLGVVMDCSGCGVSLTEASAFMTGDGAICDQCQAEFDLQELFRKGTLRYAWGALSLMVLATFVFDPFAIVSIGALFSCLKFHKDFSSKDEDHQKALTRVGLLPKAVVVFVILVSVVRVAITGLQVLGLALASMM
jgi:hypothetical protein